MKLGHFVDVSDFSPEEYDELFSLTNKIIAQPADFSTACQSKIMATLFYEPSTRTRLSFEAAMKRLGGSILTVSDAKTSSVAKGETIPDTIRTIGQYTDLIVMRHPKDGAARLAAQYAPVPFVNAGDGAREHPTQTLTDMFTIKKFQGRLTNLKIAFCGDLKYGRTVHSLIKALSWRSGTKFILVSPPELQLPDEVKEEARANNSQIEFQETTSIENALARTDVLYMTRIQKERFFNEEDYLRLRDTYVLTRKKMASAKKDMIIMHPLPRINEISLEVDQDPRAVYFEQVRLGMFVRMALIVKLLEKEA